jgi:hypothetical protein
MGKNSLMLVLLKKIFFQCLIIGIFSSSILASEYPKSRVEEFQEKNGSILGDEGIVFRWGKEKKGTKNLTQNTEKHKAEEFHDKNHIIWKTSLDFVWDMPILYIDHSNFLIITDWYLSKTNNKQYQQIKIHIGNGANDMQVKVYLKQKNSGIISESKNLSDEYKSEILSKYKLLKK